MLDAGDSPDKISSTVVIRYNEKNAVLSDCDSDTFSPVLL